MYISFLNIDTEKRDQWSPEKIGINVRYCPHCKRPLSYSDKMGLWCRGCQTALKRAMDSYRKAVQNGR